ncbi:(2Fe-2S)-binding protein [uncultured Ramlibacter sp.]|uniref:(2Fe-2S)-binding protein n=1 Tax=uncultured Ramlibacter sp. TaxID=260755 RepID=UPI00262046F6|nr:(2Fe-2S)-binding protein [uncultured Ramlibacter sp.]
MTQALLQRLPGAPRPALHFELDGVACTAQVGDTVLTAVLTQATRLRQAEASGAPRAGFCLMGACQDCWVQTHEGRRLRACSTLLEDGMRLVTGSAT